MRPAAAWPARWTGAMPVIAMQAPVGDRYATDLMGGVSRRWPAGRSPTAGRAQLSARGGW